MPAAQPAQPARATRPALPTRPGPRPRPPRRQPGPRPRRPLRRRGGAPATSTAPASQRATPGEAERRGSPEAEAALADASELAPSEHALLTVAAVVELEPPCRGCSIGRSVWNDVM